MPGRVYDQLLDLAFDQYGYVTSNDARAAGVDPRRLVEMERRGSLVRVAHGLYRFPVVPTSDLDRMMEAVLWPRVPAAISHESALDLHELCDVNPLRIHITVPAEFRLWRTPPRELVLHRRDLGGDLVRHEGIPVVTPLRAIRDGIEQHLGARLIDQAIETARRRGLVTPAELDEIAA
jgi:predicted transcriptional regulator of viral defense system